MNDGREVASLYSIYRRAGLTLKKEYFIVLSVERHVLIHRCFVSILIDDRDDQDFRTVYNEFADSQSFVARGT